MGNLDWRRFDLGWTPDFDAENAPQGALLRADNTILDMEGAVSLRQGSVRLFSELSKSGANSPAVNTVRSFLVNDKYVRFAGVGNTVFADGVDLNANFDGFGDVAFGTDAYQVFFARGHVAKKYDGQFTHKWGIPRPELAPTATASNAITKVVASFDSVESPAFVVTEGTGTFVTSQDGVTANGALQLAVSLTNGRASAYKKWTTDQDFLNVADVIGGDTDLFDMYTALSDPDKTDTITVMFGLGTGSDPFKDDYYYFDFKIKDKDTVNLKDSPGYVAGVYQSAAAAITNDINPLSITSNKTPAEVIDILSRLGRATGSRSRERKDSVHSSPAWGHFAVTRGQFNRVGSTSNLGWANVRGFKVVVQVTAGIAATAQFDSTIYYAGGARALTGTFRVGYRYARDFGPYVELSPISPVSAPIVLNQQGINLFIPAAAVAGADPQVNQAWIYMFGGFLDTYYRVAVIGMSSSSAGMSMDEFDPTADATIDANDRTRFTQHGLTIPGFTPNLDLNIVIRKSETEALRDNVALEPYLTEVPDNIVAVEGPIDGRMFVLTTEGWLYPSSNKSPSSFQTGHVIDLRRYGDPLWMKRTNGGLHVGMTGDIIRIAGSGDISDDQVTVDLFGEPLHVSNPPVDAAVYGDGSTIVYRAADGLMALAGATVIPVSQEGVSLLWRGVGRHGVEPLDIATGRFRIAIDNHIFYMVATEGNNTRPIGQVEEQISWTGPINVTINPTTNTITKKSGSSGTVWDAGAISSKYIISGNGYVGLRTTNTIQRRIFGLCPANDTTILLSSITFGAFLNQSGQIVPIENGFPVSTFTPVPFISGDEITVGMDNNGGQLCKNGIEIYRSPVVPSYPLIAKGLLLDLGSVMESLLLLGNWTVARTMGTPIVWRYNTRSQKWARFTYPFKLMSIDRAGDGAIIVGDDSGNIWELERGTQDNGVDIQVLIASPFASDESHLNLKSPLDMVASIDTGNKVATVSAFVDGGTTAAASFPVTTGGIEAFRNEATTIGDFSRLKWQLTGSFFRFVLRGINLSYRMHPQQVMAIDSGYLIPPDNSDFAWIDLVEISARSPVDLSLVPTFDDVQYDPLPVRVTGNFTSTYQILLKRGQNKGRRPRMFIRSTNIPGVGNRGFEVYYIRVWFKGTGNKKQEPVTISYGSISGQGAA